MFPFLFLLYNPSVYGSLLIPVPPMIFIVDIKYIVGLIA